MTSEELETALNLSFGPLSKCVKVPCNYDLSVDIFIVDVVIVGVCTMQTRFIFLRFKLSE